MGWKTKLGIACLAGLYLRWLYKDLKLREGDPIRDEELKDDYIPEDDDDDTYEDLI